MISPMPSPSHETLAHSSPGIGAPHSGVRLFGREEALDMIGGDEELLHDVVTIALEELSRQLAALRDALAAGDAPTARRHAHTMKGTVATLGAGAVREKALEVEHAARDSDLPSARVGLEALEPLVGRLLEELRRYQAGAHPA
ncbi:MAG: Hpt domain-containing protein [Betaproteobacteria bacterium]|nr:Hpt domain-containing protein [Betaproteobacteria bacterium]